MNQLTCSRCGAVGAEHYTYKTKAGDKPLPNCKACHNAGKYQKKGTGWARVSEERNLSWGCLQIDVIKS